MLALDGKPWLIFELVPLRSRDGDLTDSKLSLRLVALSDVPPMHVDAHRHDAKFPIFVVTRPWTLADWFYDAALAVLAVAGSTAILGIVVLDFARLFGLI
jgi:hypothetical protein